MAAPEDEDETGRRSSGGQVPGEVAVSKSKKRELRQKMKKVLLGAGCKGQRVSEGRGARGDQHLI